MFPHILTLAEGEATYEVHLGHLQDDLDTLHTTQQVPKKYIEQGRMGRVTGVCRSPGRENALHA